jgi:hypothetical protein
MEAGMEYIVHKCLEGGGGIGESERHDQEFEVAMVHPECHFGDVLQVHQHLVVIAAKIKLGEIVPP